jgi:UDP-N-acetylmuramoylalanine--D-glutamate ligase
MNQRSESYKAYREVKTAADFREFIKNRSISVVGIARSNTPLLRFLKNCGAEKIKARDRKDIFSENASPEAKELAALKKLDGIDFILGENYLDGLTEDVIFKTPVIRRDSEQFLKAEKEGSIITSEMELFFMLCPAKTVAVTGSEGKTTTTTVIGNILKAAGRKVYVGGNIGAPLLGETVNMKEGDFAVLELSSFQLFDLDNGIFSPDYSVITNITPNHLDWHKDMREYAEAKKAVFKNQDKSKRAVLGYDCEDTRILKDEVTAELFFFSKDRLPESCENGVYCGGGDIIARI